MLLLLHACTTSRICSICFAIEDLLLTRFLLTDPVQILLSQLATARPTGSAILLLRLLSLHLLLLFTFVLILRLTEFELGLFCYRRGGRGCQSHRANADLVVRHDLNLRRSTKAARVKICDSHRALRITVVPLHSQILRLIPDPPVDEVLADGFGCYDRLRFQH